MTNALNIDDARRQFWTAMAARRHAKRQAQRQSAYALDEAPGWSSHFERSAR